MLASLKWINEYTTIDYSSPQAVQSLCDKLDLTGTGVEGVQYLGSQFDHIVTGQVIEKVAHPDSDHMWVCKVDVGKNNLDENGNEKPLQIVCGAQNFEEGDKIVVSMVGAVLPGDIKIKKSKLRGVVSEGMNCSERELGLGNDHDGIMILDKDAPIGINFADYMKKNDVILDLEITPNRPDCMSIRGLSREISAIYNNEFIDPLDKELQNITFKKTSCFVEDEVEVEIDDPELCPRYACAIIKDVEVKESPTWLIERLAAMGQRSVNNIVDITNYIMFLYGQPMHAFDLDWLKKGNDKAKIIVRAAKDGEVLTTLDGTKRELSQDMTLITTQAAGPVGLAGVMGGMDSEITQNTKNVVIEIATFNPGHTSRTSRNLKLFSEASMRYERQVDDHEIEKRAIVAANLIQKVAGGEILSDSNGDFGLIDIWPKKSNVNTLNFRIKRFQDFVGEAIPKDFISQTLYSLGCEIYDEDDELVVKVPTFRPDLTREIDLYEEVLRIYGEDRIPDTLPRSQKRVGKLTTFDKTRRDVVSSLRACGMNETISYSFVSEDDNKIFSITNSENTIDLKIKNPINAQYCVMRRSILPCLIRSVSLNKNHNTNDIKLFEIGTVFESHSGKKLPKEKTMVAGVFNGSSKKIWDGQTHEYDFYDAKGVVENVLSSLCIPKIRFKATNDIPYLFPGRTASVFSGGTQLGIVGELHPNVCEEYDINDTVVCFELDFVRLINCSQTHYDYKEISEFPSIEIDQNFVCDENVTCEKMMQVIASAGGKMLNEISLVDIYRNPVTVGIGKKSMSFKLVYSSIEKTLTAEEVEKVHAKLVKKVSGATGATLRGKEEQSVDHE